MQLRAHQAHQLAPERGREDRIAIGHHRLRNTVEADDVGEERLGDELHRVGVHQQYEVAVLPEPIHHGEDDRLALDAW